LQSNKHEIANLQIQEVTLTLLQLLSEITHAVAHVYSRLPPTRVPLFFSGAGINDFEPRLSRLHQR